MESQMLRAIAMAVTLVVGFQSTPVCGEDRKPTKPKPVLELQTSKKGSISEAAFLPDNRTLLMAGGGGFGPAELSSWSLQNGKCLALYTVPKTMIYSVAVSPDGKKAATGGYCADVKVWDLASGKILADLDAGCDFSDCVTFSPDGKLLASGGIDAARVWNVETHECVADLPDIERWGHHEVCFSPDGKILNVVENGGVLRQWDVSTWKEFAPIEGLYPRLKSGIWGQIATSPAYSQDGKFLAISGGYYKPKNYSVKMLDVKSRQVIREFKGHEDSILSVLFSRDGQFLITGSSDHTIKIWDVGTGNQIASWTAHDSVIRHLAISRSGKLLASCGGDHFARVWDLEKIIETR
jgi:WD40 repeat protein